MSKLDFILSSAALVAIFCLVQFVFSRGLLG